MPDIKTTFIGFDEGADYAIGSLGLDADDGLESAVIISLFTDRRANDDDVLPDDSGDRRGWWGDTYSLINGDQIGSRLWLLHREKQMQSVVNRAQQYAEEALQWLIDDGIASAVRVTAEIVRTSVLGLFIEIDRPGKPALNYRYEHLWEAHSGV